MTSWVRIWFTENGREMRYTVWLEGKTLSDAAMKWVKAASNETWWVRTDSWAFVSERKDFESFADMAMQLNASEVHVVAKSPVDDAIWKKADVADVLMHFVNGE